MKLVTGVTPGSYVDRARLELLTIRNRNCFVGDFGELLPWRGTFRLIVAMPAPFSRFPTAPAR